MSAVARVVGIEPTANGFGDRCNSKPHPPVNDISSQTASATDPEQRECVPDEYDHCEWVYWLDDGTAAGTFSDYRTAMDAMVNDSRVDAEDDIAHLRPYCTRCDQCLPHFWGRCGPQGVADYGTCERCDERAIYATGAGPWTKEGGVPLKRRRCHRHVDSE